MLPRRVLAALLILDAACACAQDRLTAVQEYLAEFSTVTVRDGESRERLSTRVTPREDSSELSLVYERQTYDEKSELRSRQVIHYSIVPAELDPGSIVIQRIQESEDSTAFWIVLIGIRTGASFISYTNLIEERKEGGTADVTSSRGRVRQVALGYFAAEAEATSLATQFREYLQTPEKPAPPPASNAKRPVQSVS